MNDLPRSLSPPDYGDVVKRDLFDIVSSGLSTDEMQSVHTELIINNILPNLLIHEQTALLLDINNLIRVGRDNGFTPDWVKVKSIFEQRCDLRYACAYSAVDMEDKKALNWTEWMTRMGYDFVPKKLLRYTAIKDEREIQVSKGNMDVEMTIGAMDLAPTITHVILGTCDGDFKALVERLKKHGARKVSVLAISGSTVNGLNRQLLQAADNFYDLYRLRDYVAYKGK